MLDRHRGDASDVHHGPPTELESLIIRDLTECIDRAMNVAAFQPDPGRDLPTEFRPVDGWGKSDEEYRRPHRFS